MTDIQISKDKVYTLLKNMINELQSSNDPKLNTDLGVTFTQEDIYNLLQSIGDDEDNGSLFLFLMLYLMGNYQDENFKNLLENKESTNS